MSIRDAIRRSITSTIPELAEAATYRVVTTYSCRAASSAPIGATSMTLNTLPAGFTATTGDTFPIGATTYTITANATPSGGTVVITFSPALVSAVSSSQAVTVARSSDHEVRAIARQVDGYGIQPGTYVGGDYRFTVFDLPDTVSPRPGHKITLRGLAMTIQPEIGRDALGAAWVLRAR